MKDIYDAVDPMSDEYRTPKERVAMAAASCQRRGRADVCPKCGAGGPDCICGAVLVAEQAAATDQRLVVPEHERSGR